MTVEFAKPSRPGVYAYESPLQRVTPTTTNLGTYGVFLGTAMRGPLDPVLITSVSEYYQIYGGFSWRKMLPAAITQFFANGGRQAFVIRVIDPDAKIASHTFDDNGTVIPITGVTAGTPATVAPAGATLPMHFPDLATHPVIGNTGSSKPSTKWPAGQYLLLKDGTPAYWDGSKWMQGSSPTAAAAAKSRVRSYTAPAVLNNPPVPAQDPEPRSSRHRIKVESFSPGDWGNSIGYSIKTTWDYVDGVYKDTFVFDVWERSIDGKQANRERFSDLSMDPEASRYFVKIINSPTIGSRLITVHDVSTTGIGGSIGAPIYDGTGADPVYLENGEDGDDTNIDSSSYADAFDRMSDIEGLFLVNVPGFSRTSSLETMCAQRGDSVLIHDSEYDDNPVIDQTDLPTSSYAATYHPWIYINDPAPGAARGSVAKVPPGASVAGMIVRTDITRGVYKSPAGLGATLTNVVAPTDRLTNSTLDLMAERHINAIRSITGTGTAVFGARTRSFGDVAQFLSVRRVINYVKRRAVASSRFALFEPNTPDLWEQIRVANGAYLSELWIAGGLAGRSPDLAFYVKCDRENNTPQLLAAGELHIEIGIAPVFPAEFVIIRVGTFDGSSTFNVEEG